MRIVVAGSGVLPDTAPQALSKRAARGELARLYPGVYLDPGRTALAQVSPEMMHAARVFAVHQATEAGVVSGLSAAVLHGLPVLSSRLDGKVMVTRRWHGKTSPWLRIRRSRLPDDDVITCHGVRVTSVQRTLRDLAEYVEPHELLAAADGARRQGVVLDELTRCCRHRRTLTWVAAQASDRSESFAESWSRALIVEFPLGECWQQLTVYDESGREVGRSDFGCWQAGLLGEVDGRVKYGALLPPGRTAQNAVMDEKRRENALRDLGWEVVRWDWQTLHDSHVLRRRLERAHERAAALPPPRGMSALLPVRPVEPPNWAQHFELPLLPSLAKTLCG